MKLKSALIWQGKIKAILDGITSNQLTGSLSQRTRATSHFHRRLGMGWRWVTSRSISSCLRAGQYDLVAFLSRRDVAGSPLHFWEKTLSASSSSCFIYLQVCFTTVLSAEMKEMVLSYSSFLLQESVHISQYLKTPNLPLLKCSTGCFVKQDVFDPFWTFSFICLTVLVINTVSYQIIKFSCILVNI